MADDTADQNPWHFPTEAGGTPINRRSRPIESPADFVDSARRHSHHFDNERRWLLEREAGRYYELLFTKTPQQLVELRDALGHDDPFAQIDVKGARETLLLESRMRNRQMIIEDPEASPDERAEARLSLASLTQDERDLRTPPPGEDVGRHLDERLDIGRAARWVALERIDEQRRIDRERRTGMIDELIAARLEGVGGERLLRMRTEASRVAEVLSFYTEEQLAERVRLDEARRSAQRTSSTSEGADTQRDPDRVLAEEIALEVALIEYVGAPEIASPEIVRREEQGDTGQEPATGIEDDEMGMDW